VLTGPLSTPFQGLLPGTTAVHTCHLLITRVPYTVTASTLLGQGGWEMGAELENNMATTNHMFYENTFKMNIFWYMFVANDVV